MRFDNRREKTGEDGADFQRFVWEALRSEHFNALLGPRYLRPYFSAGRDGAIDHLGVGNGDHIIVECKFFGVGRSDEPRQDWVSLASRLGKRLPENASLPVASVARSYKPWLDRANQIRSYWFCTSGKLTPGAQVELRQEIKTFFVKLAESSIHLQHLASIDVQVLGWSDFEGALAANPSLRFRWFDQLPLGLSSLGALAQGRTFRGFLERLSYASRARFNAEMQPGAHLVDESALLDSLQTADVAGLVLHGPGGVGKTRLALELGRMAEARGWLVLRVERNLRRAALDSLIMTYGKQLRLLLVIDYAEASNALLEVLESLRYANEGGGHAIRFVATCRTSAISTVREVLDDTPWQEVQFSGARDERFAEWVVSQILDGAAVPSRDVLGTICAGLPVLAAFSVYLHTEHPQLFDMQFSALHLGDDLSSWAEKRLVIALRAQGLDQHATRRALATLAARLPIRQLEIDALRSADGDFSRLLDILLADRWFEVEEDVVVGAHDIFADVLIGRYIFESLDTVTLRAGDVLCDALSGSSLDRAAIALNRLSAHPSISGLDFVSAIQRVYTRSPTAVIALRRLLLWVRLPDEKQTLRLIEALPEFANAIAADSGCDGPISHIAETIAGSPDSEWRSRGAAVLIPILERAVDRRRLNNMVLRRALLLAPSRFSNLALSVIRDAPTEPQTHFLLVGWLRAALEPASVKEDVDVWLRSNMHVESASFVLSAWLKIATDRSDIEFIVSHLKNWLIPNGLNRTARFVYRAWLDCAARLEAKECGSTFEIVEPYIGGWLEHHGQSEVASLVYAGWMDLAGNLGGSQGAARIGAIEANLLIWLKRHGGHELTQFVYYAWLNAITRISNTSSLDIAAVERFILAWCEAYPEIEKLQYILYAWLHRAATLQPSRCVELFEKIQPFVLGWLVRYQTSQRAQFVYRAWLDASATLGGTECAAKMSLIESSVLTWISNHATSEVAQYVFRGWLFAAAGLQSTARINKVAAIQDSVLAWIASYATLEDAQFIYRAWLVAGAPPQLISAAMLTWLKTYAGHHQSDFLFKAWLEARQDFEAIRDPALAWLRSNTQNEEAVFVLKFIVRDPRLSDQAVQDVLTWCRAFPRNFDSICRVGPVLARYAKADLERPVVEVATLVLEMVEPENVSDRGVRDAALGTLGQLIWKISAVPEIASRLDAVHARLLRHSSVYDDEMPMPPNFALNPMLANHFLQMLNRKILDPNIDYESLKRFVDWLDRWPRERREMIRSSLQILRKALAQVSPRVPR